MCHTIIYQDLLTLANQSSINILDIRDQTFSDTLTFSPSLSTIQIPATEIPHSLKKLDKNKVYYVIDHTGERAKTISAFLTGKNFQVIYLIGGMETISYYCNKII